MTTILFLHGFLGDRNDFRSLFSHLPSHWNLIALDLPGHGENSLPEGLDSPCTLSTVAALLRSDLDCQNLLDEPPILYGYSMGGRIALKLAMDNPASFRALILESASPGMDERNENLRTQRIQEDQSRAKAIRADFPGFLRRWYSLPLFGPLKSHRDFNEMLERRNQNNPDQVARIIEEMSPGAQKDLTPALASLVLPTLLLAGEEDKKYSAASPSWAKALPKGEARIISGAGHNCHVEKPEELAIALQDFVAAL